MRILQVFFSKTRRNAQPVCFKGFQNTQKPLLYPTGLRGRDFMGDKSSESLTCTQLPCRRQRTDPMGHLTSEVAWSARGAARPFDPRGQMPRGRVISK